MNPWHHGFILDAPTHPETMEHRKGHTLVHLTLGDISQQEVDTIVTAEGPQFHDGQRGENVALERTYADALAAAKKEGARRIAFPAIGTGAKGFAAEPAALIGFGSVYRFLRENGEAFDEVRFVTADEAVHAAFAKAFAEVIRTHLG